MQTVSRKQDDNDHRTQAFGPGRRRPKGLHAEIDFRGNPIWTYREGHGTRIRINEAFGTQAFEEAYYKARLTYGHADAPVAAPKPLGLSPTNPASLAWLIDQFLRSPGQRQMAEGTQKQRRNILGRIAKKNGSTPFRAITDDTIRELRDTIAATGKLTAANSAIAQLRLAFDWAVDQKHVAKNPCLGVKGVKYKGGTNHVWTDVEASRFEQAYPLGSRERLAYALLLYSGQRGVDVVKMGRQHIHDGSLTGISAQKTGKADRRAGPAGPAGGYRRLPGEGRPDLPHRSQDGRPVRHRAVRPLVPRRLRQCGRAELHAARPQAPGRHPLGGERLQASDAAGDLWVEFADGDPLHPDRRTRRHREGRDPPLGQARGVRGALTIIPVSGAVSSKELAAPPALEELQHDLASADIENKIYRKLERLSRERSAGSRLSHTRAASPKAHRQSALRDARGGEKESATSSRATSTPRGQDRRYCTIGCEAKLTRSDDAQEA